MEWALRLAAALFRFWEQREQVTEGRETLARVLAMSGTDQPTPLRARALYGASVLADVQGDLTTAEACSREACEIYRRFGDTRGVATTMTAMAWQAQHGGRYAEATRLHAETVSLWQELGDTTAVDLARFNMANAARVQGDVTLARSTLDYLLTSSEARHDLRAVASALNGLGDLAVAQDDYENARRYHNRSLGSLSADRRSLGCRPGADRRGGRRSPHGETMAPRTARSSRRWESSASSDISAASLANSSDCPGVPVCERRDEAAVRLASAAAAIRQRIGAPIKPSERARIDETLAHAREHIDPEVYAVAWRDARTATLESILEMVLSARPEVGPTDTSADRSSV